MTPTPGPRPPHARGLRNPTGWAIAASDYPVAPMVVGYRRSRNALAADRGCRWPSATIKGLRRRVGRHTESPSKTTPGNARIQVARKRPLLIGVCVLHALLPLGLHWIARQVLGSDFVVAHCSLTCFALRPAVCRVGAIDEAERGNNDRSSNAYGDMVPSVKFCITTRQ
jgi:hypothetical protein